MLITKRRRSRRSHNCGIEMAGCFRESLCTFIVIQTLLVKSQKAGPYIQVYPRLNETDERAPIYFALMLSFGGDYVSVGALPGVQIALDYINSEPSLLPGYTLHYTLTDSQVSRHRLKNTVCMDTRAAFGILEVKFLQDQV